MSDDSGYTLTEALVALAIVALALAGVTQAARLATRQSLGAARGHETSNERAALQRLLSKAPSGLGPYFADEPSFVGDQSQARFDCLQERPCTLQLITTGEKLQIDADWGQRPMSIAITGHPSGRLSYVSSDGVTQGSWPIEGSTARLSAIVFLDGDKPLAVMRLPITSRPGCEDGSRTGSCLQPFQRPA